MAGVPSIQIGTIESKGGHGERFTFQHHQNHAKLGSYGNGLRKDPLHIAGLGIRGNIIIFGHLSQELIAHAAASQEGLIFLVAKALYNG